MNIYEITGDILALQDMLESDPDNETIIDTLEAVAGELEVKAEGYCKVIKNIEAESAGLDSEIKRLSERKKSLENGIDRMKKALYNAMNVTNTPKIKGELFTLSIRNNGSHLPKDLSIEQCPASFLIEQKPTIDKKGLLQAVKDGTVTGIELVSSTSLMIK